MKFTQETWSYPISDERIGMLAELRVRSYGFPAELLPLKIQHAQEYNVPGTQSIVVTNETQALAAEYTTINLAAFAAKGLRAPLLTEKFLGPTLLKLLPDLAGVYSICVSPGYKRDKIAQRLLNASLEGHRSKYIIGGTQSPSLLLAAVRSLGNDYSLYYGAHQIIDEDHVISAHSPTAFMLASILRVMNGSFRGPMREDVSSIPPHNYDLASYPIAIRTVLSDVMTEQLRSGNDVTITMPFIRILKS